MVCHIDAVVLLVHHIYPALCFQIIFWTSVSVNYTLPYYVSHAATFSMWLKKKRKKRPKTLQPSSPEIKTALCKRIQTLPGHLPVKRASKENSIKHIYAHTVTCIAIVHTEEVKYLRERESNDGIV